MKNLTAIVAICAISLISFSNFTTESVKSFVITTVNNAPVLPETPFDYADIEFPAHLLDVDSMNIGYEAGGVDTFTVSNLNNNAATLGRVLFYDQKLSALENISCASCHQQEKSFADELALSEGISAPTKRNSMALNDLGWSNKSHFFWDMSQLDLHEMIVLPLTDENEIGANMEDIELKLSATSYYPELFENAYGTPTIDEERIVDALVQFINSMVTFNSKFDQSAKIGFQDFTSSELNGLELFSTNCNNCHSQGSHNIAGISGDVGFFGNGLDELEFFPFLFNNGLPEDPNDNGAGSWDDRFNNLFKIPSLRNIAKTGPYMHDGRFETLEDVLDHYSEGIEQNEWNVFFPTEGNGFNFSTEEKKDIIAFLNTLSDDSFTKDEKWSDPFETKTSNTPGFADINFIIKPNPMMDRAVIEFENNLGEAIQINVLTSSGQLIEKYTTQENKFELDKNKFMAGMYFVEISQGEKRSLQKLIVQ